MQSLKCRLEEDYRPFWNWLCRDCNAPMGFYSVAPERCFMCGVRIPFNPKGLIEEVEERVRYHVQSA